MSQTYMAFKLYEPSVDSESFGDVMFFKDSVGVTFTGTNSWHYTVSDPTNCAINNK